MTVGRRSATGVSDGSHRRMRPLAFSSAPLRWGACGSSEPHAEAGRLLKCPPFQRTAWLGLSADLNSTGERMASAKCGWTVL